MAAKSKQQGQMGYDRNIYFKHDGTVVFEVHIHFSLKVLAGFYFSQKAENAIHVKR